MDKYLGIKSEAKYVGGAGVQIFVQEHGKTLILQVVVFAKEMKYADIAVVGLNQDGKEIETKQLMPTAASYGITNPGGPVGAYKIILKDGERLATVNVTRGDDRQIFDVTIVEKKP